MRPPLSSRNVSKDRLIATYGVLLLLQPLAAAPSQSDTAARANQEALHSFCQTFHGRYTLCERLPGRSRRSTDAPWGDLLTNGTLQMPDTKWCGAGSSAASYDDLGEAKATDRCCRSHDHCPVYLEPGETRGGATNIGTFTRSACDCDTAFFNCLTKVNTVHSQVVGELYFNVLMPSCINDTTYRCSKQKEPGHRRKPEQERLRLVTNPLAGQFPKPANEEGMLEDTQQLAFRAWSALTRGK